MRKRSETPLATGLALQMGKVATVGLASTIFGPLQNVTGSALANWFRKRTAGQLTMGTDLMKRRDFTTKTL